MSGCLPLFEHSCRDRPLASIRSLHQKHLTCWLTKNNSRSLTNSINHPIACVNRCGILQCPSWYECTATPWMSWYQALGFVEIVRSLFADVLADDAHVVVASRLNIDAFLSEFLLQRFLCLFDARLRGW